jgi:hypothetical protein
MEDKDETILKDWAPQLHQGILDRLIGRSHVFMGGSVPRRRLESRILILSERER